jgi:hypothetical protein
VAFDTGLNGSINDAASLMEAYNKALKEVKRGQEALFSSQMGMVDAEIAYRGAVEDSIQALGKSGGNFNANSEEGLKARKGVAEAAQAILDVGNAAFANTEGNDVERGEAGSRAAQEYYNAYVRQLKKSGMSDTKITEMFSSVLGKNLDSSGTRIEFTPEFFSKTFSTEDIDTTKAQSVGGDIPGGVAEGVRAKEKELRDAAVASAQAIVDAYEEELGIKSPSTVMRDKVGIPIVQGIAKGFLDGTPFAIKAASNLISDIYGAMDAETQKSTYQTAGGTKYSAALRVVNDAARAAAAAAAAKLPTGADKVLTGIDTTGKSSKADETAALIKNVKLQGKKVSTGVYDIMSTNLKGQDAAKIAKIGGDTLKKWAEGVVAAKAAVKTPVADLIREVLSEVTAKLGKITALIDAKLNLESAKNDLKKFLVLNTTEMLSASVNAATRAKNQASNKFGGNQGTDVTKYEKSQIKTAAAAAQQAARDYRLGKISFTEYQDAQDALVNTQAEAAEASKEVASTTNDLSDAQLAQETSGLRAAQAGLAVITAQDALTTAYTNAKLGGQELKDLLASLSKDVLGPLTSTTLPGFSAAVIGAFTDIVNKSPASMGLGDAVTKLLPEGTKETNATQITNTPTPTPKPTAEGAQMSRALARATFLADANKRLKTKYKTVTEYINGGANATRDAARQALWDKYVKDNNVAAAAKGGALSPGRLTLVGESGPELITPNAAARITPYSVLERYARTSSHSTQNGQQGSSNPISITVNNPVPERASDSIARRMQNMSSLGLFG